MIISGAVPGIRGHLGLIGCTEKGMCTVAMKARASGGHSSMPPINEEGIISIMGKAVTRLEANPFPAHFGRNSPLREMLEYCAWRMSPPLRLLCSNLWLFAPLLKSVLLRMSPGAAASIRTTTAVTMIEGGTKFNVLPYSVTAYVNHRIEASESISSVISYDRKVIDDSRIEIRALDFCIPPAPKSATNTDAFHRIQRCVQVIFDCPSVPTILTGNTDTRHYWSLSSKIYRFSPIQMHISDASMFHGVNERISVEALAQTVDYYQALILLSCLEDV